MSFGFDYSDKLQVILSAMKKRNPPLVEATYKKIKQIVSSDAETIEHYKNLRAPMNEFKRVHIGSFVLTFKVFKERNFILFADLEHHDDAYR